MSVTALTGVAVTVVNILGGIIVFGDPLAHSPTGTLAEGVAFALICVAAFLIPTPSATDRGDRQVERGRLEVSFDAFEAIGDLARDQEPGAAERQQRYEEADVSAQPGNRLAVGIRESAGVSERRPISVHCL